MEREKPIEEWEREGTEKGEEREREGGVVGIRVPSLPKKRHWVPEGLKSSPVESTRRLAVEQVLGFIRHR